jgi:hypothetical protein
VIISQYEVLHLAVLFAGGLCYRVNWFKLVISGKRMKQQHTPIDDSSA